MRGSIWRRLAAAAIGALLAFGVNVALAAPAHAAPWSSSCNLTSGSHRWEGTIYGVRAWLMDDAAWSGGQYCQINKARLIFQRDGNLVVYDENNRARWAASWTKPEVLGHATFAQFQDDGNFVVYKCCDFPVWASNTCCRANAMLAVQADGNVVIYDANLKAVWATNTWH